MDLDRLHKIGDEYHTILNLQGFPVAVKMLESENDLNSMDHKGRPIQRLNKRLAVCQLLSQARFYGRVIGATSEYIDLCKPGADSLGFDVPDYTDIYDGTYFADTESARRFAEGIPKLERNRYKCILVAPLQKAPIEPDVVVVFGNVAQITRLILGYLYDKGVRMEFSCGGGAALDADVIAAPMLTQEPKIGISCNGGRVLAVPNETDLVFGIPSRHLSDILDGIKFTGRNIPIGSPTLWQHIDWEPQPPVRYFLQPELDPKKESTT